MDTDGWSLGFGFAPNQNQNQPQKDRAVGVFLDLSSVWQGPNSTRTRPVLHHLIDELCKLALTKTSRAAIDVRIATVETGLLSQNEHTSLEELAFETDQVASADESYERMSNAILLWLWDKAAAHDVYLRNPSQQGVSPDLFPCVTLITSNPKFGPLLTKLRRRNVFVLLVSELSGSGERHPVPLSLRKDANVLYDFNEICLLLERFGLKSSQSSDAIKGEGAPYPPDVLSHEGAAQGLHQSENEDGGSSWVCDDDDGDVEATIKEEAAVRNGELVYTSRTRSFLSMGSVESEVTLDGLDGLDMDAQSLDLRLSTALPEGLAAIGGAADAARLLSLPRAGGLTRSETVNFAVQQLEAHVTALETAWVNRNVPQVARLLRIFARAGYNVQPYVRRLILGNGASGAASEPALSQSTDLSAAPTRESSPRESSHSPPGALEPNVHATTFGFVLDCVRNLYERHKSLVAPISSLSSLSSLENSMRTSNTSPPRPPVSPSLHAIRSGADALDASHVLISALEGCHIGELNEELHRTAVDLVHSLLDRSPAFTQADRLLRIVGVSDHLSLVLQPYVEKWMKVPDQSASAQAFSFAYRSGLMDSLREKQVTEIDGRIPRSLAMLQQQGQRTRQHLPLDSGGPAGGPLVGKVCPKEDDDGWYIGSSLEVPLDHGPSLLANNDPNGKSDSDGHLMRNSQFEIRGCSNASSDSLSALMLQPIEPISSVKGCFSDNQLNMPESIQERVMELLVRHKEGLLGSDVPRLYSDEYGERLVLPQNQLTKERMKLKDFLLSIDGVGTYTRNTQPVFIAIAPWGDDLIEDTGNVVAGNVPNDGSERHNPHHARNQLHSTLPMTGQEPYQQLLQEPLQPPHPQQQHYNLEHRNLLLQQQQYQYQQQQLHHQFSSHPSAMIGQNDPAAVQMMDRRITQLRLARLLQEESGILGAQLPSRYLETYGGALSLDADDGSKVKLKEYLLSDEMTALLRAQEPPLKLVLTKAGHDRRYTIESWSDQRL